MLRKYAEGAILVPDTRNLKHKAPNGREMNIQKVLPIINVNAVNNIALGTSKDQICVLRHAKNRYV